MEYAWEQLSWGLLLYSQGSSDHFVSFFHSQKANNCGGKLRKTLRCLHFPCKLFLLSFAKSQ